ncbi:CU044_5270 family protein [Actinoallomurus sp. NPDC052308]|uniref:CU044_5270 family protein n=1 Tax=Actinoallomurus sp. NPDC052308 TaxID=3155530 RepID=UPI003416DB01
MKVLRAVRQGHLPSDAAHSAARAALLERAAAAPLAAPAPVRRFRLPRVGFRLAAVGALAVTIAAGVTVAGYVDGPAHSGEHRPSTPGVSAAPVAYVLDQAADAAQARPFTAPRNDQWVYVEVRYQSPGKPINGQVQTAGTPLKTRVGRTWTRADGTKVATVENGKIAVSPVGGQPRTDYATLKALPRNPAALLAWVRNEAVASGPRKERPGQKTDHDAVAFSIFNSMLVNGVMPPAQEAAIFRAVAKLPDVTVDRKAVDVDGRPVLAVSHVTEGWLNQELLLDPATYAYLGQRNVAIKDHTEIWSGGTATTKEGAIDVLISRLAAGVVDRPGQRP